MLVNFLYKEQTTRPLRNENLQQTIDQDFILWLFFIPTYKVEEGVWRG